MLPALRVVVALATTCAGVNCDGQFLGCLGGDDAGITGLAALAHLIIRQLRLDRSKIGLANRSTFQNPS